MVKLEHANFVVKDIEATLDFILTAFPDWRVRGGGDMKWYGKPRRWLHVGDDDYYVTLNDDGEGENRDLSGHQIGLAHLGFVVDDLDAVIARLKAKGYRVDNDGAEHPFRRNVYFIEPAGFEFEFVEYLSDDPKERNLYDTELVAIADTDEDGAAQGKATEPAL